MPLPGSICDPVPPAPPPGPRYRVSPALMICQAWQPTRRSTFRSRARTPPAQAHGRPPARSPPLSPPPNTPGSVSLAQGGGSDLAVIWTVPATDSTHSAATGFNLRSSPSGAGTWTTVSGITSPYELSGLTAGAAIDVRYRVRTPRARAHGQSPARSPRPQPDLHTNAPAIANVAPPPDGTTSKLAVTWTAPAVDSTHGAATGYNLRSSPTGAGAWTTAVRGREPLHNHRAGGRDRDRRRNPGHERRGQVPAMVRRHHRHDLGRHRRAGRLDRLGRAGSQHLRRAERRGANDRDRRTDRGDQGSVLLVDKPGHGARSPA